MLLYEFKKALQNQSVVSRSERLPNQIIILKGPLQNDLMANSAGIRRSF